jgi:hypothetical protein
MELQRALDKPALGKNVTPMLGLIHQDLFDNVSPMVRGAAQQYPHFHLRTYNSLADAQKVIHGFLADKQLQNK